MNCPFTKKYIRILSLTIVFILMLGMMTGCMGKEPDPTDGSGPNPGLNLVDPDPTDGSEPTETQPTEPQEDESTAYAVGQANILNRPGPDGTIIGYLSDGDRVEILEVETMYDVEWAMIREGWVAMENLRRASAADATEPSEPDTTEPEETQPEETQPQQGGDDNKPTGDKTMGVVTASELNIRKEASTNSEKVGSYKYGDRIAILEIKNGWGRTDKGWISMTYVYQDGTTGANACKGIVTGTQLNVRSGPGTNYDKVASYDFGTRVNVLHTIKVGDTTWGCTKDGWIAMGYVYVDGTKGENGGTGTMTGDGVNIRSGPGTNYDSVGSLNKGTTVEILHQVKIDGRTWGCISKGWIAMEFVDMDD